MNLGIYLDEAAARFSSRPVFRFYDETWTYGELRRRVDSLASGLARLGIRPGEIVHVLAENHPDVLAAYFAIQKIGAVAGPINNWWKAPEVEYLLNDSRGRGLIVQEQFVPLLTEIRARCPHLEHVIEIGPAPRPGHVPFEQLAGGAEGPRVTSSAGPEDVAYIFYTSGTTGNPKGVLLTHRNVLADVDGIDLGLHLDEGMTVLCFLPLFHVNAMLTCVSSIKRGHTIVLRKGFSAGEFWEVVDRYKVNFWSAVPAVYNILLTDPGRQKYDLSSLKFGVCGAAPLTLETMKRFEETFKIAIVEGYGLTEATCVSTINPRDGVRKAGSIGLPLPGQSVKVVDEAGRECAPRVPGEIVIGGDVVMKGYFNRPEETAQAVKGGLLHTGDVAYRDEDGYLFIVDRLKEMVIRGGENIYPKEIDNLLATHPKISEAAAIGVPDAVQGEEVKVFVRASDDSLTEDEVIAFCKQHLAAYKVPRYVEILAEDFPRNAIGKVLKKELKKWGLTPRPKPKPSGASVEDIFGTMPARFNAEATKDLEARYGYRVTGAGGGEWTVAINRGTLEVERGLKSPAVTVTVGAQDFVDLNLGKLEAMAAFTSGKVKVEGEMGLMMKVGKLFKKYSPPQAAGAVTVGAIFQSFPSRAVPKNLEGVSASLGYRVTGTGGGEWTIVVKDGQVSVREGLHAPGVTTIVDAKDFVAITLGQLDGMAAFTSGKVKVEGDVGLLTRSARFFKKFTAAPDGAPQEPKEELIVRRQLLSIPQRFTTGPLMGRFLLELRDHQRITGNRCPRCRRVMTPPREVCAICRLRAEELIEIGPEGKILSFDVTYYSSPDPLTGESRETPYCAAFLLLDGCTGNDIFWHEIKSADIPRLRFGARVRPVWAEQRTGAITDIKYFELVD